MYCIVNLEAPVFLYGGGEIIDLFSNYIHLVQDLKLHCKWTIFLFQENNFCFLLFVSFY